MTFQRRVLHHGPDPAGIPQLLSQTALRSCWFELHRQGGCGSGQLVLSSDFELREEISLGDWISFETEAGARWYLGRVEERAAETPAEVRFRLEGMSVELNQIFPGGFGITADGRKPHRYGMTDLFPLDPDYQAETFDFAGTAEDAVRLLMTQYVAPATRIQYAPGRIEKPALEAPLTSLKVRGEESVRSLIKDLALRAQGASWGVDAAGEFFFLRPRQTLLATYQEQQDLTALAESRDLEFLFNRLLLTGDYVYDHQETSGDVARKVYRWRGNFFEPASCSQFGDRRLKIWLPWIRTQADSRAFAREFFRTYSQPVSRYFIETTGQTALPAPWLGEIQILNRTGQPLIQSRIETLRVLFDHVPRFRMELGPEDPRALWPEPPQDERWELPNQRVSGGGIVSFPSDIPKGGNPGGGGGQPRSSSSVGSQSSSASSEQSSAHSTGSDHSTGSTFSPPSGVYGSEPGSYGSLESSSFHSASDSSSMQSTGSNEMSSAYGWPSSGYGGGSYSSSSDELRSSSLSGSSSLASDNSQNSQTSGTSHPGEPYSLTTFIFDH